MAVGSCGCSLLIGNARISMSLVAGVEAEEVRMVSVLSLPDFIARWQAAMLTERSAAQQRDDWAAISTAIRRASAAIR